MDGEFGVDDATEGKVDDVTEGKVIKGRSTQTVIDSWLNDTIQITWQCCANYL